MGIKARSHSMISVLILNPRGDFSLLMAPEGSRFSQTCLSLCGPVYLPCSQRMKSEHNPGKNKLVCKTQTHTATAARPQTNTAD